MCSTEGATDSSSWLSLKTPMVGVGPIMQRKNSHLGVWHGTSEGCTTADCPANMAAPTLDKLDVMDNVQKSVGAVAQLGSSTTGTVLS